MNDTVVYGAISRCSGEGDVLVFVREDKAGQFAKFFEALSTATTWGEFLDRCPDGLRERIDEAMDETPLPGAPFDMLAVPSVADGDWDAEIIRDSLAWMLSRVQTEFGASELTVLSGEFSEYLLQHERAIAKLLGDLGIRCRRDDDLVRSATNGQPAE